MSQTIVASEPAIRFGLFICVYAAFALWETLTPRRQRAVSRWARWPANLGIAALNTVIMRVLSPAAAVGFAAAVQAQGLGALNQVLLPAWLEVVVAVVILDFAIYLQHVLFHAVPVLWRVHRMHHADLDFDVTTGIRFHPIEIVLSTGIKLVVILALGPAAIAVLIFEVLLNATSMFNHANLRIPQSVDRVLRWLVVTPDMHRVHHSVKPRETNSNFGFNLPWWDRLLGSYRGQPEGGHAAMTIGLNEFRATAELRLDRMLLQPLRGSVGQYPFGQG